MRESFEHFYLTKVALGEGCGCAEHVTRIREIGQLCGSAAAPGMSLVGTIPRMAEKLCARGSSRRFGTGADAVRASAD